MIGNWNARDGGLVVCKLPKVKAGRPVRSPSESTTTTRPPSPQSQQPGRPVAQRISDLPKVTL